MRPRDCGAAFVFLKMIVVVTGGVACGKSRVSRVLCQALGARAEFHSSDEVVSDLWTRPDVVRRLVEVLGEGRWLDPDGRVRRDAIRERIMSDAAARKRLEAVLHPLVFAEFDRLRASLDESVNEKVLVAEVPLFYEVGSLPRADCVVVVAASPTTQIERMRLHRGLSESAATAIIGAQMATLEKVSRSDRVIWNDGGIDALDAQVRLVAQDFLKT